MNEKDVLAGLEASLEGIFDDVDEEEIVNVKALSHVQLFNMISDLTDELMEMKQSVKPQSQEARDKHSLRNACQVELRDRGYNI